MAAGVFTAVFGFFHVHPYLICFRRAHLTLTLEASGGIRLATLPQAFAVHHWLRRGRGAVLVLVLPCSDLMLLVV